MAMPTPTALAGQSIQLHDIHTPEQISNFPIAPGWWILLILIVVAAIILYKKYKQRKQLNAIKNQALALLNDNQSMNAKACIALLKWAAMHYFSREELAKVHGVNLQLLLMQQLPDKHQETFKSLTAAGFETQYQAEVVSDDIDEVSSPVDVDCQKAAKIWLTHALPVNKNSHLKAIINNNEINEALTTNGEANT